MKYLQIRLSLIIDREKIPTRLGPSLPDSSVPGSLDTDAHIGIAGGPQFENPADPSLVKKFLYFDDTIGNRRLHPLTLWALLLLKLDGAARCSYLYNSGVAGNGKSFFMRGKNFQRISEELPGRPSPPPSPSEGEMK